MKSKRVILDTNLWISFLISRDFGFLDNFIETGKIKLIFSEELFSEFISVTERPKFKKYFNETDVKHLIRIIDRFGMLVQVTTEINRCRDIKDNFLLSLAIDSNADYLVTGDNDLLDLEYINKTKIITIQGLRDELK
jgi:putative PIN family toxin of toxin-antitoxin system